MMIVRQPTGQEIARVEELMAIAFETPLDRTAEKRPWPDNAHPWAAYCPETGEMMSALLVTEFKVRFDGCACKMGGVGGAATLPQYRRRGGIRGCFAAALPQMYESGCDFSYLYPFSTAFYRKFGYESCVQKYQTTVDLGMLQVPAGKGYFRLAEDACPMTAEIRALDRLWEERFNMMVLHQPEYYRWTEEEDPAAKQEFTYVCFDGQGQPCAYTTFRRKAESGGCDLVCSRFLFRDREGFRGLMELFKRLSAGHRYVKFLLPAIPALQYLLPEWSMGAAAWTVQPAGMVRVVNACAVLEKARYRGSGRVVLSLEDQQIPQNCGVFAVEFREGAAVSVARTAEEPDALLTMPAFSALMAGTCEFIHAQAWLDGLTVKNAAAPLDRVFYRKPMMIVDRF